MIIFLNIIDLDRYGNNYLCLLKGDKKIIECKKCGSWFRTDDIKECCECLSELCESCYAEHSCKFIDDDHDEYTLPSVCPYC
ncbi:hypothetical protein KPL47_22625 [Clostridium estertheticum]|uniref:hypothetical protein n=1 Tax=Clostridium estertheticum TaxID=238834 RepID=UPI001C0CB007|nr:hypothetical protein [Clostridium estertheticum]MBU3179092.1 hypothetical protein [Clostridium estertheticum]